MKFAITAFVGLAVGFLAGSVYVKSKVNPAEPPAPRVATPPPAPAAPVPLAETPNPEVEQLRAKVAELETKLAKAAAPPVETPAPEAEIGTLTDRIKAIAPKGM